MNAQIRPGRFKLAWFVAGSAVVPVSAALTIAVLAAAGALLSVFDERWYLAIVDGRMIAFAIYWFVNGSLIGLLQKAIVKRYLRVDLGRWTVYSSLGGLLAGAIAFPCLEGSCLPPEFYEYRFDSELTATPDFCLVALLYLTVFSAVQCLALNRLVSASWRWIAAYAGPLILTAFVSVTVQTPPGWSEFNAMLTLALSVLVVTVVTGIVMQRLLTSNRRETKEPIDEWANQPAAIESQSAVERSVWDDAI